VPKLTAKQTTERRQKVWFLMLQGNNQQQMADILHVSHVTIYNDIKFLTAKSKQYIFDLAKGTHILQYQRAVESAGLILTKCWEVFNSKDPQINYFHKMAALKLALLANESMANFVMNGSTVLGINRIVEKANRLNLLSQNEPLTETEQINNYINSNSNNNNSA